MRIVEFWSLLKARVAILTGRRDRARTALKQAVRRNPGSFVAHFLLGKVYWRDRAVVKAKREFDLAWQIDPERFERAYSRLRAQHEQVPELFSYPGSLEEVTVPERAHSRRYIGDFADEAEQRHFRGLPPITRDEITGIDWDRFQDEIIRDQDRS